MRERKYVSDYLDKDIVKKLEKNKNYMIRAGTGAGKTYWIKNVLTSYCRENNKKLLILSHLKLLKSQTAYDVHSVDSNTSFVDVATYQSIVRKKIDLNQYDYVVFDEIHMIHTYSWTNITLELLGQIDKYTGTKIFITATAIGVSWILGDSIEFLYKEYGGNNVVERFEKTKEVSSMQSKILKEFDERGVKSLVFNDRSDIGLALSQEHLDSKFVCSKNNKNSRHSSEEEIDNIVNNKKFSCGILYTTKVLEAGVDIIDSDLGYVCVNGLFNEEEVIQLIGRVRECEDINNKINVIVVEQSKKKINGRLNVLRRELKVYQEYVKVGNILSVLESRVNKFRNPRWLYIDNDGSLKADETKIVQIFREIMWYSRCAKIGYTQAISEVFDFLEVVDLDMQFLEKDLLKMFTGKRLFKEDQKSFKEMLSVTYGLRADGKTKGKIGIKTINAFFEENKIPYVVESSRVKKDGKLYTIWELFKIEE